MPIARFEMPDGRIARFEVPEGTTPEQAQSMIAASIPKQKVETPAEPKQRTEGSTIGDIGAGLIRGAGSIGATLLAPYDIGKDLANGKGLSLESNRDRRHAIDMALSGMGADTESIAYQGGKLGSEIAGTAGVGGVLANGMRAIPTLAKFAPAVQSGGFSLGSAATGNAAKNAAIRAGSGAVVGGASAGMIDPETAGTGAVIGGVAPGAVKVAGYAGQKIADGMKSAARSVMQSALKPTIAQLKSGEAKVAVDTLLENGISPTEKGVEKIKSLIDDLNTQIEGKITYSNATIDRPNVMNALNDVRSNFGKQVSPTADLNAIQNVADDFYSHPSWIFDKMPVQTAQELKQGTYKVLNKKYGQLGSAETEAQKGLARGLKEEIARVVPDVAPLNAKESALLKTLTVAERRALMDLNKNPAGLSLLANSPSAALAFMADRSAAFKGLAARAINQAAKAPANIGLLNGPLSNPALRAGLLAIGANP